MSLVGLVSGIQATPAAAKVAEPAGLSQQAQTLWRNFVVSASEVKLNFAKIIIMYDTSWHFCNLTKCEGTSFPPS